MILGIDVGGTHTDAVLLDNKGLVAWAKVETVHQDLLFSIRNALSKILKDSGNIELERFNLSTTLCTNAIVQDELEDVGVLVCSGPGISPEEYRIGDNFSVIAGGLDHRGSEIKPLDLEAAQKAVDMYIEKGIKVFAVVSKFSPRNPNHEEKLASLLKGRCDFLTQGHTLSGQLNFPRRISTSYYNSAVWPIFNNFLSSVEGSLQEFNLAPALNILKADGGTMPFELAKQTPVESIFSGPAASIMGIMALCEIQEDALLLDVGGTTTDVAVFASGDPLIEAESVELEHRPTLVKAMKIKSIGIGGDSAVSPKGQDLSIGPKRLGPCMAQGGSTPTLVDALNCLKSLSYGDVQASNQGMQDLGNQLSQSCEECSKMVVGKACKKIKQETDELLTQINERPVYTVHELLEYKTIQPKKIYLMGGPAEVLAPYLSREFGLPAVVPENFAVANALGAALARPTRQAELFADTEKSQVTVPVLEINEKISKGYSLDQAKKEIKSYLSSYLENNFNWKVDPEEIEIIEESAMNMVKDVFNVGQDIRVKCQIKPGICKDYGNSVRCLCKER